MIKSVILLATTMFFFASPILAQGLKGSMGAQERFGHLEFISGKNDAERWKKFTAIQPRLVGMSIRNVRAALGEGTGTKNKNELLYHLTEKPVKSGLGAKDTWLDLEIEFRNGVAWRFTVSASS